VLEETKKFLEEVAGVKKMEENQLIPVEAELIN
jgi:hypothetical protein